MRSPISYRLAAAALGAVFTLLCQPAAGQEPAPTPTPVPSGAPAAKPWYDEIAVNGFVSVGYSYNTNRPDSRSNQLRVFDFDDNSFKVDVAELVLQRAVSKPGEVGFRVDAVAGSSIPRVSAASGLFQGQDFDLQQAFVSYIAPVGSGLRFDAGKFVTHFGQEVIEGYDGWNDNATHSFLFGFAIPFTHTGLKATYSFSDQLSAMLEVCNGWDVARDNNSSKSIGAQLSWTPAKNVSVFANVMTGPERTGVNGDPRTVVDVVAQWKATDSTVFTLDTVWGTEKGAVVPGQTAKWWAVVGYARLGVSDTFGVIFRAEYFDDGDGARTGAAQKLKEVTVTPEVKISSHLQFRADLRVDWSDKRVFEKRGGETSTSQPTVALNAIYAF